LEIFFSAILASWRETFFSPNLRPRFSRRKDRQEKIARKPFLEIFFSAISAFWREMLFAPQQNTVSRQGAKIAKRKTTKKESS
jgi:hypothetical protein